MLSNWYQFLNDRLKDALPEHDEDDRDAICRVFDVMLHHGRAPTPREVVLFVNQMGVLHRQWRDVYPLDHMAYYVLLRRRHSVKDLNESLLKPELPHSQVVDAASDSLRESLAGLLLNVEPSLGMQLLLRTPIETALKDGAAGTERLENLKVLYPHAFWTVMGRIFREGGPGSGMTALGQSAQCLHISKVLANESDQRRTQPTIQNIGLAAKRLQEWERFDDKIAEGVAALCRVTNNLSVSDHLIKMTRTTVEEMPNAPDGGKRAGIDDLINDVITVCDGYLSVSKQSEIADPFVLPVNHLQWLETCEAIARDPVWTHLWARDLFLPNASFDQVSDVLSENIENGKFTDQDLVALKVSHKARFGPGKSWEGVAASINNRIRAADNTSVSEIHLLLRGLRKIEGYGCALATEVREELTTQEGHVLHYLQRAVEESNQDALAYLIVEFISHRPSLDAIANPIWQASTGHDTLVTNLLTEGNDELARRIVALLDASERLALISEVEPYSKPLFVSCLQVIADSNEPGQFFTTEMILADWAQLRESLGEKDGQKRFEILVSVVPDLAEAIMQDAGGFEESKAELYNDFSVATDNPQFRIWCQDAITDLGQETWDQALAKGSSIIDLIQTLKDKGTAIALDKSCHEALFSSAASVSAETLDDLKDRWNDLFKQLIGTVQGQLRDRLLDELIDNGGSETLIALCGMELSSPELMKPRPSIVRSLFTPFIENRNESGIRWLQTIARKNPHLLDDFNRREVGEFRGRMQRVALNLDLPESFRNAVRELTDLWG